MRASGEGYKDKTTKSRIAAAWGYTRRTGVSHSFRAHWASRRGKKMLFGLFVVMLSSLLAFVYLIRISAGLIRNHAAGGHSHMGGVMMGEEEEGVGLPRPVLPNPDANKEVEKLVPIDWAAKNLEDKWEQPVPRHLHLNPSDLEKDEELTMPVRIPIDVKLQGDNDLDVELCQFDISHYHREPEKYPMNKDLIKAFCGDSKRVTHMLASTLLAEDKATAGTQLQPTGFIFHESRVGSTLVANMLASVPTNLVYSESSVPFSIIHACDKAGCSEEVTVRLLRLAILSMGRSHHHDQFFIKFQSSWVPFMDLVLKAFPTTPWIFIYRDPVEIMVSNFGKGKGNGPCTRSKKNPPEAVLRLLGTDRKGAGKVGDEDYCAAHLAMLCEAALAQVEASGSKGYAVAYDNLVEDVMKVIIPGHFGVAMNKEEEERMNVVSGFYSKARGDAGATFEGDVEEKHEKASAAMETAATTYLAQPTASLRAASTRDRHLLESNAALRAQEAKVYEATGSRFFSLPHCPDEPEYPPETSIMDLVNNWNPDDISIPARHYSTLCRIDYQKDYDKALRYRDAEVPFITYNIPEFEETVEKWNTPGYLHEILGDSKFHVEISKSNHFMYYHMKGKKGTPAGYVPPTQAERWSYDEWLQEATKAKNISAEEEHYYFRVSSPDSSVVKRDLHIFDTPKSSLFMKEPRASRGIHCRFGMRGVISEAHFDASRNMVGMVSGTRRWILAQPNQCKHAYLLPMDHPSGRHSEVDWSAPDLEKYPDFPNLMAHEVILTKGEVLNVPAWWMHFIENLDINTQCNSRSGDSTVGLEGLAECGFNMGPHFNKDKKKKKH